MANLLNESEYTKLLDKVRALENDYIRVYDMLNRMEQDKFLKRSYISTSTRNKFTNAQESVQKVLKDKVMALRIYMEEFLKEWQELDESGRKRMATAGAAIMTYGSFVLQSFQCDYSGYKTAQFMKKGSGFYSKYSSDMKEFMESDLYKTISRKYGLSIVADWHTYWSFFTDDYSYQADEYLESTITSILEAMPDSRAGEGVEDPLDALNDLTGMKSDKAVKLLCSLFKQYAADGKNVAAFFSDPQVKEVMRAGGPEYEKALKQIFTKDAMAEFAESISKGMDVAEGLMTFITAADQIARDYSAQVEYLQAITDSLVANGLSANSGLVLRLNEIKEEYDDNVKKAFNTLADYGVKLFQKAVEKKAVEGLAATFPGVKQVYFGLKVVDTVADFAYADEIKVFKTLEGMVQYDDAMSKAYQMYVSRMQAGLATPEDMAKADKLYEIIKSTKIKEYQLMAEACEDDFNKAQYYRNKAYELESMK